MVTTDDYKRAEFDYALAESKRGWKIHAAVYAVVMTGLVILNAVLIVSTESNVPWFLFPLVGWGIGVAFHYVYGVRRAAGEIRARQTAIEAWAERTHRAA